ncbi:DUF397 domain-containing protein [Frankia sp. AgPm24]|uniref:DUF397 domain-containing protein n=1 Tax=Frankia sp. AgPm24 TaxID=631128 RepID=UPI0020104095|nr:DUF397 domain-containing protein [Frankia sp. AgPm24]MCK9923335.1 DUF397 domain-containing protein [Frankia sp. AgPm24]
MNTYDLSGAKWRKSSYSNAKGECVEVAFLDDDAVAVRDSKDSRGGPALIFTKAEWSAFLRGAADGEFTA